MTIDIFHVSSVKTWVVISADAAVVQKPVSAYVNLVKIWFKKVIKKKENRFTKLSKRKRAHKLHFVLDFYPIESSI